jgi:uncharacterized protein YegP (UPF0339 family)
MATATKKGNTAAATAPARRGSGSAPLEFLTYRDNGGNYRWEIVDGNGESVAHSECFPSQQDAEDAARNIHRDASSARFQPRASQHSAKAAV